MQVKESSRLEFLEKFSASKYCFIRCRIQHLQAVEYRKYSRFTFFENTIHQKSRKPSFWEVIQSFVLLAFARFVASRTLLQWLVTCLNLALDADFTILLVKAKTDFHELWQQHKQLKIMQTSEDWPDIYDDEYILITFFSSSRSAKFKNILSWNISQMVMKAFPSSTRIMISYVIK